MKLATSRFGEIEIDPDRIITFSDGIIGFRELKRFALIVKKSQALMWLQSLEDTQIAFVVADPFSFEATYDPILSTEDRESLELKEGMLLMFKREDGMSMPATVKDISEKEVSVDFNHPLAGQTLIFDIELVEIK